MLVINPKFLLTSKRLLRGALLAFLIVIPWLLTLSAASPCLATAGGREHNPFPLSGPDSLVGSTWPQNTKKKQQYPNTMKLTKIQWCHSTSNPVMGCPGCELFPTPEQLFRLLEKAFSQLGLKIDSRKLFKKLIAAYYAKIRNPGPGHLNEITTTNIWHLREVFAKQIAREHGKEAGRVAFDTIKERMKCYAATLHLNRAANIVSPDRGLNSGYAPTFEQFTSFKGRLEAASKWSDLLGTTDPDQPWLDFLARLIFLSDMGDALCSKELFPFLEGEMPHISSENGRRHLWLWLTKRPQNMKAFADRIGGFPDNVVAMTTVTSRKTLHRVDKLRQVKAACRGLSIEPLWERIPPEELNLDGIDWVVLGGESGNADLTAPFHLEWAEELREHCRRNGVSYFMKQIGRKPFWKGKPFPVSDKHGGDWSEWPAKLRVRQFPAYFRNYRGKADRICASAGSAMEVTSTSK